MCHPTPVKIEDIPVPFRLWIPPGALSLCVIHCLYPRFETQAAAADCQGSMNDSRSAKIAYPLASIFRTENNLSIASVHTFWAESVYCPDERYSTGPDHDISRLHRPMSDHHKAVHAKTTCRENAGANGFSSFCL